MECVSVRILVALMQNQTNFFPQEPQQCQQLADGLSVPLSAYAVELQLFEDGTIYISELMAKILHAWLRIGKEGNTRTLGNLCEEMSCNNFQKLADAILQDTNLAPSTEVTHYVCSNTNIPTRLWESRISMMAVHVERVVEVLLNDDALSKNPALLIKELRLPLDKFAADLKLLKKWRFMTRRLMHNLIETWQNMEDMPTVGALSSILKVEFPISSALLLTGIGPPMYIVDNERWNRFNECPYELKEFLGFGSFGVVFAVELVNRKRIAVKFLNHHAEGSHQGLERECSPTNTHPNLVKTFKQVEVNSTDIKKQVEDLLTNPAAGTLNLSNPYLLFHVTKIRESMGTLTCIEMELCGPTLRAWRKTAMQTKDKPATNFDFTANIAANIICGLQFLHARSILHRDLKPDNIYFSEGKNTIPGTFILPVKIGDFGQCRDVPKTQTITQTNQIFSELYRAKEAKVPEQGSGKLMYGKNADWFSAGLILYEIFYLIPDKDLAAAFDEVVNERTLRQHVYPEYALKFERIDEIILGLTQKKSEQRKDMIHKIPTLGELYSYIVAD